MKRFLLSAAALALTVVSATAAHSTPTILSTNLSGANEVGPNASPGTGFATVTLDDVANTLALNVTFSGLTSNNTAAHIHCCAPAGTNAGVATTTPTFAGFPAGVSGTYVNTLGLSDPSSYNPAFVTAHGGTVAGARTDFIAGLLSGNTYLNIHTGNFPGGEIRGQLAVVPEPATWAMLIFGFVAAGGTMRLARRKQGVRASVF